MKKAVPLAEANHYLPKVPILTSAETAKFMAFGSTEALARARLQGRLPIQMFQIPGRRGWFALTNDVRAWLELALPLPANVPDQSGREARRLMGGSEGTPG